MSQWTEGTEYSSQEAVEWWRSLKVIYAYPRTSAQDLYAAQQCDGCYDLMTPTDVVTNWINRHYQHRAEILRDLPDGEVDHWGADAYQNRRKKIQAAYDAGLLPKTE